MKKLLLLLLFFPSAVLADNMYFNYGIGIVESAKNYAGEVKTFGLGVNREIWNGLFYQAEAGVWADSQGNGRLSSGYANLNFGLEVNPGYLIFRSSWGLAGITHPDSYLGSHLNFSQDLFIGVKDHHDNMLGIDYRHMSNAGLASPNVGRDFITIQVGIPF